MCVYIWYNVLYNIRNAWWVQCFLCFLKSFSKSCRRSARSSRPLFTRAWHSIGTWRRNRELSLKDSQHLMIDVHSMRGNRWKAYHKCKKRYRGRTIVLKFSSSSFTEEGRGHGTCLFLLYIAITAQGRKIFVCHQWPQIGNCGNSKRLEMWYFFRNFQRLRKKSMMTTSIQKGCLTAARIFTQFPLCRYASCRFHRHDDVQPL